MIPNPKGLIRRSEVGSGQLTSPSQEAIHLILSVTGALKNIFISAGNRTLHLLPGCLTSYLLHRMRECVFKHLESVMKLVLLQQTVYDMYIE